MNKLNDLLQELGVSKVRLAKYLGVSRQMVYNYLELNDINKWPKEKKILLFKLLDVQDGDDGTIGGINVTTEYLMDVENRLNQGDKNASDLDSYFDLKGLSKEEQNLLIDITYLLKERLLDEKIKKKILHLQLIYIIYYNLLIMFLKLTISLDILVKLQDLLNMMNINLMKTNNLFLKVFYILH